MCLVGRGQGAPLQDLFQHMSAHFQPQDEHLVLHLFSLLVGLMGVAQVLLLKSFFNISPPISNLSISTYSSPPILTARVPGGRGPGAPPLKSFQSQDEQ